MPSRLPPSLVFALRWCTSLTVAVCRDHARVSGDVGRKPSRRSDRAGPDPAVARSMPAIRSTSPSSDARSRTPPFFRARPSPWPPCIRSMKYTKAAHQAELPAPGLRPTRSTGRRRRAGRGSKPGGASSTRSRRDACSNRAAGAGVCFEGRRGRPEGSAGPRDRSDDAAVDLSGRPSASAEPYEPHHSRKGSTR